VNRFHTDSEDASCQRQPVSGAVLELSQMPAAVGMGVNPLLQAEKPVSMNGRIQDSGFLCGT